MDTLRRDLRYALRMLCKAPTVSLIALLSLAFGIGANTAIFSIVNGLLLRPLPFHEPDRLVALWTVLPHWGREEASAPDFQDWRKAAVFDDAAAFSRSSVNLGDVSEPRRLIAGRMTAGLLPVLKLDPIIGRNFTADEDRPGAPPVALLGYSLWHQLFNGERNALGKTILLSGVPHQVIAVLPPEMNVVGQADLWVPAALRPDLARRGDFLKVIGRLKPGVSVNSAQSELSLVARRLSSQYPETNKDVGIELLPLQADLVRSARPLLLSLWGAVGFVLLIVVANVANLLLSRGSARNREVAIRVALGARPQSLFRQLVTESMVLAVAGGALGVGLAYWGMDAFIKFLPWQLPPAVSLHIDPTTLLFALAITLSSGFLFGSLPALHAVRGSVFGTLKDGGWSATPAGKQQARRMLAAAEIAISLLLLVGAGLMVRTMNRLLNIDPGFRADGVLTFHVSLPSRQYKPEQQTQFFDQLIGRLESLPGMEAAAASSNVYLSGGSYFSFEIEGQARRPEEPWDANTHVVTPGFLKVMGLPLLRGRSFTDADVAGAPRVAMINEKLARQYFGDKDPIGRRISFGETNGWREIVGIVGNVRQEALNKEPYAELIVPMAQAPRSALSIVIRSSAPPSTLMAAARREIRALDPNLPVYGVQTMSEVVSESLADRAFQSWLLGSFAALALLLASIGIYGVMAQVVAQRTPEFGVRLALGAQRHQILSLVIRNGFRLILAGLAVGLFGSLLLARFLRTFVFGISTHDPLTVAAVVGLLGAVALVACYVPARRAMRVDPMTALRNE